MGGSGWESVGVGGCEVVAVVVMELRKGQKGVSGCVTVRECAKGNREGVQYILS